MIFLNGKQWYSKVEKIIILGGNYASILDFVMVFFGIDHFIPLNSDCKMGWKMKILFESKNTEIMTIVEKVQKFSKSAIVFSRAAIF